MGLLHEAHRGGGLGMKEVLDYMGIPTGCGQTNLVQFTEDSE